MRFPSKRAELYSIAASHSGRAERLACSVLELPGWESCAGSLNRKHHFEEGGLQYHTWEVVKLAEAANTFACGEGRGANPESLFLAALFHDVGKLWDYGVGGATHKRRIHHITRSSLLWSESARKERVPTTVQDDVLHAILSHHGSREFGSSVSPATRLAWILHTSDLLSARLEDCERVDRFA